MKQTFPDEPGDDRRLDLVIGRRIRGLRLARGWSLKELAARCYQSPSNVSRLETGQRRIAIDQLVLIARALGTTLDQLTQPEGDEDVVIRPTRDRLPGATTWLLTPRERAPYGLSVMKVRYEQPTPPAASDELRVHPGRDWLTVLVGVARLQLAERTVLVGAGESAEFSTMTPHAFGAEQAPLELLCIFDGEGARAHEQH